MPKAPSKTAAGARGALSRERIVDAAIALADDEGLGSVTMRKVAGALGFEAMALYNHVANKDELLTAMTDGVADLVERPDGPWHEAIRTMAVSARAALEQHPWCVALWASHFPGPIRLDLMEWMLRRLSGSELSAETAHHAFHAINNHVIGYVLQGAAMPKDVVDSDEFVSAFMESLDAMRYEQLRQHIQQHLDGDTGESFELVLDLIIDGLLQRG